ncbi:MAG TPA: bifunctional riboflavin kinase/FAD synthetase [Chitinophagaceae bacterium]|nr:bifunctional riboflavin kinase/FAD synthetase [Chitinophagaceae bacterium]
MRVHRSLDRLPSFDKAVVTIGTFDGVHSGHRRIIRQLTAEAKKCGGESVIITFDPHPRKILAPDDKSLHILTTLAEKIFLLGEQQVDHLVIVPFTLAFSRLSAAEYVADFLVAKFHPHTIIIGYDHHFGHNREGDIHLLRSMEARFNFTVLEIPPQVVHDITVSSTQIRKHLAAGHVKLANELLGYPYFVTGEVIHGDGRGRGLGFPTANLALEEPQKLIPAAGIYAARVKIPSPVDCSVNSHAKSMGPEVRTFDGAANIGWNPTFQGTELRIEVHILDFAADIYGKNIQLAFFDFIRPEERFDDAETLVSAITEDVKKIKQVLPGLSE